MPGIPALTGEATVFLVPATGFLKAHFGPFAKAEVQITPLLAYAGCPSLRSAGMHDKIKTESIAFKIAYVAGL